LQLQRTEELPARNTDSVVVCRSKVFLGIHDIASKFLRYGSLRSNGSKPAASVGYVMTSAQSLRSNIRYGSAPHCNLSQRWDDPRGPDFVPGLGFL
jgi:hypothetical protein